MTKVTESYFALLRAALWGGDGLAAGGERLGLSGEEIRELIDLAGRQGTGSIVYPILLLNEAIPSEERMKMKAICAQTMQEHVRLKHILGIAWQALTDAGIEPVLLKGAGLAALYPGEEMRQWGDIDLFVGKKQYHPACAAMRKVFPNALKFDEELDHYKHYNLIADGISIEIHRVSVAMQHPVDEIRYAQMEERGMNHPIREAGVRVPEPTFNALFVFLHAWEHMMTKGANIRQLCDLALVLDRYQALIDARQLARDLRALKLMDVWRLYVYIMVHYLGLNRDRALTYSEDVHDRAERFVEDLLDVNGVRPAERSEEEPKEQTNRWMRKIHTMRERLAESKRIERYSPEYARHMRWTTLLHGAGRLFAKDRRWE